VATDAVPREEIIQRRRDPRSVCAHEPALLHVGVPECFELRWGRIRDGPIAQSTIVPMKQAVPSYLERPLARLTTGGTPDEHVDLVQTTAVDENGGRMTIDVVEPPAEQWKSLVDEIDHRWRDVRLPSEPRLHRVPVRRNYVEEMVGQERTNVRIDQLIGRSTRGGRPDRFRTVRESGVCAAWRSVSRSVLSI
jgi:hypothetical protein